MDVSSITANSTTSQTQSLWQSRRQQFQQNLQTLGSALQAGDLAGAQQDFQTLLQGLPGSASGVSGSSAASGAQGGPVAKDLTALKSALQSGNLSDAQQAYQTLTQDLQAQGAHHHHHHHQSQATTSTDTMAPMSVGTAGTTINLSA